MSARQYRFEHRVAAPCIYVYMYARMGEFSETVSFRDRCIHAVILWCLPGVSESDMSCSNNNSSSNSSATSGRPPQPPVSTGLSR